jgi:CubicO group peptidase (beta-lactamase class C family)
MRIAVRNFVFSSNYSLEPNPSQPPLLRGGAGSALPLKRGSWRGLGFARFRNGIFIALAFASLAACSTPPPKPAHQTRGDYTATIEYISWLIRQEMNDADVTGLSIALVDDQRVVWAQGLGYADKLADIKATPDTVYHLGSIAKVFTATAAMQLAEQGKLNIDQPLQKALPEFAIKSRFGSTDKITPRNIMTHHSGLPCNWVSGMSERHPAPFTAEVNLIKNEYTAYPPDYIFAYSNLGVTLLGTAIGEVSGENYASYMDTHLLRPLGMTHSEFAPRIPGKSYEKGREVEAIPLRDLPSGGLNSSANDMTHFMQMVFADGKYDGKQIIQASSLREMFKVQNANLPMDFDWKMGLGWILSDVTVPRAGTVASHGGTTLNYHSMMTVLPEHKLGVVVLANSTSAHEVVHKITAETLKLALEAKRGIAQPEPPKNTAQNVPLTLDNIRAFAGYFDTLIGLVKVENSGDSLYADVMGWKFELRPRDDQQFGVRLKLFGFIPLKIDALEQVSLSQHRIDGRNVLALTNQGQTTLFGEKLAPTPIPASTLDYVGNYEIANKPDGPMPEAIHVTHEDGFLIGSFTLAQKPGIVFRSALLPLSDTELVMAGIGPGKAETLHLKKTGDGTHIYFSGFDLRKKTEKH